MSANKPIRLSPSGPNLNNAGGAPFAPGPGARLRLVEAQTTITGTLTIPTAPTTIAQQLGLTTFFLQLTQPDPNLEYRADILLDVVNPTTNVSAQVELYLDTSTDGATWLEVASNAHVVGFSGARQIRLDKKLTAGSAIGVGVGQPNLYVRARIGASINGGVVVVSTPGTPGGDPGTPGNGPVLLQLEECF